jgi:hypothetical protein
MRKALLSPRACGDRSIGEFPYIVAAGIDSTRPEPTFLPRQINTEPKLAGVCPPPSRDKTIDPTSGRPHGYGNFAMTRLRHPRSAGGNTCLN